jgi:3-hydroxyisobutyrate dehydrogenase
MVATMRVAFLGLGRMGVAMAHHVSDAGHELVVWNRSPGKAGDLLAAGAKEARTPGEAVRDADAVVLMLFGPDSVREVLPDVLDHAPEGVLVVNSTTVGPADAREFGRLCAQRHARYVDAPVTGTVGPAEKGTLGVLVGCDGQDWEAVRPLLELWGDPAKVRRVGDVGAGSALKLVVNQGIGVVAAGLGETLRLGAVLGVDRGLALDLLSQGAYGWVITQKRAMIESGDFSPAQFSVDLLAKDLALAVDSARDAELAVTRAALDDARKTIAAGHSGEDYSAITGHLADEGEAGSH